MIEFKVERDEQGRKNAFVGMNGDTNDLLDEISFAAAAAIVELIDDLHVQDDVYEMAAQSVRADIPLYVRQILTERESARDAEG